MFARSKRFSGVMASVFHVPLLLFLKVDSFVSVRLREETETRDTQDLQKATY